MGMNYACDNDGHRMPVSSDMVNPLPGSGALRNIINAATNYTLTVIPGATYKIVARCAGEVQGEVISLSITGTAVTSANKEWNFNIGQNCIVVIPLGVTTLNMVSTVASVTIFSSRISD